MCNIFKMVVSISTSVVLTSVAMATSAFAIKTDITDTEYSDLDASKKENCVLFARYKTTPIKMVDGEEIFDDVVVIIITDDGTIEYY